MHLWRKMFRVSKLGRIARFGTYLPRPFTDQSHGSFYKCCGYRLYNQGKATVRNIFSTFPTPLLFLIVFYIYL